MEVNNNLVGTRCCSGPCMQPPSSFNLQEHSQASNNDDETTMSRKKHTDVFASNEGVVEVSKN